MATHDIFLSIVIPAYNEAENIKELYSRLKRVLKAVNKEYEIIFVDDGSRDKTKETLLSIVDSDITVKAVCFKRNFGKASALSAGFSQSRGKYIITMDADLQDDPDDIPLFLAKMEKGYDMLSGWRFERLDPWHKKLPSHFFNMLTRQVSGLRIHDFNCGFKCYRREVVESIDVYGELHRYLPALAHWKGFIVGEMKVRHHRRLHGKSKYGYTRLFKGFFDLVTLQFMLKYGNAPLHFFGFLGFLSFLLGLIPAISLLYDKFVLGQGIIGRPLMLFSILFIILGMQLISIGLVGEIITRSAGKNTSRKIAYTVHEKKR